MSCARNLLTAIQASVLLQSLLALIDAPAFNYDTSSEMYVRWPAVLREATIATDEVDTIVASLRQQAAAETAVSGHYIFQFRQECQALSREGASPFTPKSLRRMLRDALALKATSTQAQAIVQDIASRSAPSVSDDDAAAAFGGVVSAAELGLWLQSYVEDAVSAQAAAIAAEEPATATTPLHDAPISTGAQSRAGTPVCDLRLARGSVGCSLLAQHGFTPVPGIVASFLQGMQVGTSNCTVAQLVNASGSNALDHSSASDGVLSISSLGLEGSHRQDASAVAVSLNYQAYGDALYLYRKSQGRSTDGRRSAGDEAPDVCDILLTDRMDDPAAAAGSFQLLGEESTNEGAELTPKQHLLLRRQAAVPSRHVPPVLVDVLTVVYNAAAQGKVAAGKRSTDAVSSHSGVRDVPTQVQVHQDMDVVLAREGYVRVQGNLNEGNPGPEIAVWFRRQYALPESAEANKEHGVIMKRRRQDGVLALSLAMRRLSMALLLWECENVAGKGGNLFNVGNGRGVLTAQLSMRQAFNQAVRSLGTPASHISDAALVAMLTQEAPYLVSPVPELPLGVSADIPAGHLAMGLSSSAAVDAVAALDPLGDDAVQRGVFTQRALWGWGPARTGDLPSTAAAVTYTVLLSALSSRLAEGWSLSSLVRFVRGWVQEGLVAAPTAGAGDDGGTAEQLDKQGSQVGKGAPNGAPDTDDDVFSSDAVSDSGSESGSDSGMAADNSEMEPTNAAPKAQPPYRAKACRFPPTSTSIDGSEDAAAGSTAARLHEDELLALLGRGARQEEPTVHPCAAAGLARETDALPGAGTGHRVVDIVDCLWALGAAAVRAWQVAAASSDVEQAHCPSHVHVEWGATLVQIGMQDAHQCGIWRSIESCASTISTQGSAWGIVDPSLDEAGHLDAHVLAEAMQAWCLHAPAHEVFPRSCVFALLPLMGLGAKGGAVGADGWHLVLEADVVAHALYATSVDARSRSAGILLRAGLLSFAQQRSLLWCIVRPRVMASQSVAPQGPGDCLLDATALLHSMLGHRLTDFTLKDPLATAPASAGRAGGGDAYSTTDSDGGSESDEDGDKPKQADKAAVLPGRAEFCPVDGATLLHAGAAEGLLEVGLLAFTAGAPAPSPTTRVPITRNGASNLLSAGSSLWGAIGGGAPSSAVPVSSTAPGLGGQPTLRLGDELVSSSGGIRSKASSAAWAAGVQLQNQMSSGGSLVAVSALGGVERTLLQAQLHGASLGRTGFNAVRAWILPAVLAVLSSVKTGVGAPVSAQPADIFGAGSAAAGGFGGVMSPVSIWGDGTPTNKPPGVTATGETVEALAVETQNADGVAVVDRPIPGGCILPNAVAALLAPRAAPQGPLSQGTILLEQPLIANLAFINASSSKRKKSKKHKRSKKAAAAAAEEATAAASAAAATPLMPGMDRKLVSRGMLIPVAAALQHLGASVACSILGPLDKGVLGNDTACAVPQQMCLCAQAESASADAQPSPIEWLSGAPLVQRAAAERGMQLALRRTGAEAAVGMATAVAASLEAILPEMARESVAGAISVPDLLASVRSAAPLLGLGLWPVQRWLPNMQQEMFKACCKNPLYVCSEAEWADSQAAPATPEEDSASSASEEGHVQGVILGGSSSEEEALPTSDESGVISSSGEEDASDGASSAGSGASSVSGAPPAAADSSSDSEGPGILVDVAADAVLSSISRVSGSVALRHTKRSAEMLLLPSVSCSTLEGDGSLKRKRRAMQEYGDIVKPVKSADAAHCLAAALLASGTLVSDGGPLAHEVKLLPPSDDKTADSTRRRTLKKKGFMQVVKLPAHTGSLWLRCVQVSSGARAVRKAMRRAGGKGQRAADAAQAAASKWGKAAAKAVRYAATDAVLTQQAHDRRAKAGSSSRPPHAAGPEAASTYGHVAPDELKRQHVAAAPAWIPPAEGGSWACVGGWRVNNEGLEGGARSISTVFWLRYGNKPRDKGGLAKALADAAMAAAGPVPEAPTPADSSGGDTSGSELPEDDALVSVPQSALQDGEKVVPSLSNAASHLPVPADSWNSQLVPKALRKLLPRCQRRYHRLFAAGSVPLNPLSVFVPEDRDGSGTLPPAAFSEVLRARLLGLGLRGETELAELLRALQHASCLGQERTGEKHRVSRSTHIDYVLFSRLLMSPESQALGVVVAARVRVALLAHARAKAIGKRSSIGTVRDVLQQFAEAEGGGSRSQYHNSGSGQGIRGRIALGDLARALAALGIAISPSHMVPLCRALGLTPDSAGRLDVDTFVRVVMAGTGVVPWTQGGVSLLSPAARAARSRLREAAWIAASSDLDVAAAIRAVDTRGKGLLGPGELKAALRMLGVSLSGSDFDALLAALDGNGSGKIGFSEFVRLLELDGGELAATHRLLHSHLVASAAEGDNALARLRAAYSAFDCDEVGADIGAGAGTGSIPLRAFVAATRTAGLPLTPMSTVLLARRFALPGTRCVDEGRGGYTSGALGFDVSYARFLAWAFGQAPQDIMAVSDSALGAAAGGPMAGLAQAQDPAAPPAVPDVWRSVRAVSAAGGSVGPPALAGGSSDDEGPVKEAHLRMWLQNAMKGQPKNGSAPDGSPAARRGVRGAGLQSPAAASRLPPGTPVRGSPRATFENSRTAAASAAMAADAPGALTPRTLQRLQGIGTAGVPQGRAMALKHMAPRRRAAFLIEEERQKRWKHSGVWLCKTCSYQNTDYARKCFMCLSACPHSVSAPGENWEGTASDVSAGKDDGSVSKDLSGVMDAANDRGAPQRGGWEYGWHMGVASADPLGDFGSPRREMDSDANKGLLAWQSITSRGLDRDVPRRTRPVGAAGSAYNGTAPSAGPGQLLEAAGQAGAGGNQSVYPAQATSDRNRYQMSAVDVLRPHIGTPQGHRGHGPYQRPDVPFAQDRAGDGFGQWANSSTVSLPSHVGPSDQFGRQFSDAQGSTPLQPLPSSFALASGAAKAHQHSQHAWPQVPQSSLHGHPQAHSYGAGLGVHPRHGSSASSVDDWGSNFGPGAERLSGRPAKENPDTMDPLRASGQDLIAMAHRGRTAQTPMAGSTPMTPSRGSIDLTSAIGRSSSGMQQGALSWHALSSGPYMDAPPAAWSGAPSAAKAALGSSMGLGSPGSTTRGVRPDYMAVAAAASLRQHGTDSSSQAATDFATGRPTLPPRHGSLHRTSGSFFD